MMRNNLKKNLETIRIGLYIRVSTEEQALNPEGSIKNQEERLLQAVKLKAMGHQNVEIFGTYIDRAKSGKDTKRRQLQRMLQDIRDRKINLVMSSETSRISRNLTDFANIWELMKANDCKFQSLNESFDTTTASGEMVLYNIATMTQFERRQISERVSVAMNERARRGLYNGGSVPIGYKLIRDKPGYLAVDDEHKEVVVAAFSTFLKEESLNSAARSLNERGFRMKKHIEGGGSRTRDGVFYFDNLYRLLTNICYIGKKKYKEAGEIKYSKAVWEPLIDEVTFERVQEKLKKNKSKKKPHTAKRYPYILSGLTYCVTCKGVMCGKSAHGSTTKVGYYEHSLGTKREACLVDKTFKCEPRRVPAKKLEPLVLEKVEKLLTDSAFSKKLLIRVQSLQKEDPVGTELKSLKAKVRGVDSQLEAMAERLSELPRSVSAAPIFKQMEKLEARKTELKEYLSELNDQKEIEKPAKTLDYDNFRKSLKKMFKLHDPKALTKVVEKMVHKVEVGIDSVRVHYYVGEHQIKREAADAVSLKNSQYTSSNNLTNGTRERGRTSKPCGTRS